MTLHAAISGTGPDLVLLHGWGLHGGVWGPLVPDLSATFRVHVVDLPGHGRSAATPLQGLDEAVEEVASVTPHASIVCGWSLGGLVAQRLARCHPERVRALALVATTPCFVERPDWPHAMAAGTLATFAQSLAQDLAGTIKSFIALNALGGANARAALRSLATDLIAGGAPDPSVLDRGLKLLRETDLRADTPRIAQPAAVIHGARDALAPVAAGRWLAGHLPRSTLTELADAAHLPFLTHPAAVTRALEALHG